MSLLPYDKLEMISGGQVEDVIARLSSDLSLVIDKVNCPITVWVPTQEMLQELKVIKQRYMDQPHLLLLQQEEGGNNIILTTEQDLNRLLRYKVYLATLYDQIITKVNEENKQELMRNYQVSRKFMETFQWFSFIELNISEVQLELIAF